MLQSHKRVPACFGSMRFLFACPQHHCWALDGVSSPPSPRGSAAPAGTRAGPCTAPCLEAQLWQRSLCYRSRAGRGTQPGQESSRAPAHQLLGDTERSFGCASIRSCSEAFHTAMARLQGKGSSALPGPRAEKRCKIPRSKAFLINQSIGATAEPLPGLQEREASSRECCEQPLHECCCRKHRGNEASGVCGQLVWGGERH